MSSTEEEGKARPLLKVAARSQPGKVAGAIAWAIREGKVPDVQAIGPSAVNQAIKAVALARIFLAEEGIEVICIPEFVEVTRIEGQKLPAIKLIVEPR